MAKSQKKWADFIYPFKRFPAIENSDNGVQFTYNLLATHLRPKDGSLHPFDQLCQELGIEHRTTQFRHPWTNGQVEITNKIINNATTKQFMTIPLSNLKGI